jgi:hypothetical protein
MAARLEGLDEAMAKLNAKLGEVEGLTAKAVRTVGLAILEQAVEDAPVDTGDLRRSGSLAWGEDVILTPGIAMSKKGEAVPIYTVSGGGAVIAQGTKEGVAPPVDGGKIPEGTKPIVTIGFSVPYAAAQHEHDEFNHPRGGRSKYLQTAIQDKADMLPGAIKESAGEALK